MKTLKWALKSELHDIAEHQHGYFTSSQAIRVGYIDNNHRYHLDHGNWLKIHKGLFRLPDYPDSMESTFTKWYLWSRNNQDQPQGIISHQSALSLYGLCEYNPAETHLTVPLRFRKSKPAGLILHKATVNLSAIESKGAFMATRLSKTLADTRQFLQERGRWKETLGKSLDSGGLTSAEAIALGYEPRTLFSGLQALIDNPGIQSGGINGAQVDSSSPALPDAPISLGNEPKLSLNPEPLLQERIYRMIFQRTRPNASSRHRAQAGFTLVELLVVVAIISVLAALLLPALEKSLNQARIMACANQQKQCGLAGAMYADDFSGMQLMRHHPLSTSTYILWSDPLRTRQYIQNTAVFSCPVQPRKVYSNWLTYGINYEYKPELRILVDDGAILRLHSIPAPQQFLLLADSVMVDTDGSYPNGCWRFRYNAPRAPGGGNIYFRHQGVANCYFADGHVQSFANPFELKAFDIHNAVTYGFQDLAF